MSHPRRVWIAFALCLAVVIAAMGWVSHTVLRLDRAQQASQRQAEREELIRLALWRMDAALTPFIATESARPFPYYDPVYNVAWAWNNGTGRFQKIDNVAMPSPLMWQESPLVRLNFRIDPTGKVTSPQVPGPDVLDLVPEGKAKAAQVKSAARALGDFEQFNSANNDEIVRLLPAPTRQTTTAPGANLLVLGQTSQAPGGRQEQLGQRAYQNRLATNAQGLNWSQQGQWLPELLADVREGQPRCVWVGGQLLLARRVRANGQDHVVGSWLDWPAIRDWLRKSIADVLPEGDLAPVAPGARVDETRRLAALPALLRPGHIQTEQPAGVNPVHATLGAAWAGLLLAAGAVAALLAGVLSLSERRGAFVTAVTHELRTPLTSMRMYTEMMADGMVTDDARRDRYLATLHEETSRLCRLVENVLQFARLESGRPAESAEPIALGELLERVTPRLRERAAQADMTLAPDLSDAARAATPDADPTALEQVLFNLVDNACKYAASADDRRIELRGELRGRRVVLTVCDHGPGVPADEAARIFRPFFRADRDKAGSRGGVGLGLAISRRIARRFGGDLALIPAPGACFELTLPTRPA